jgi:hypothetical protein
MKRLLKRLLWVCCLVPFSAYFYVRGFRPEITSIRP